MDRCRVCHNQDKLEIIQAKEMFIGTRLVFEYLYCSGCRSLSIRNMPESLDELYRKYPAFDFDISSSGFWRQAFRRFILLNQNFLARFLLGFLDSWEDLAFKSLHGVNLNTSMKILDVGCGNGLLIKNLKEFGFKDLTGLDPHLKNTDQQPGFRMLKKSIYELDEQFDVVMCHHSFEHLEDIHSAAKRLIELIAPGGLLLIRIPNIESYSFKKYKESWHGIHAPFHSVLPSEKGMRELFNNECLKLIEKRQEQLVELFLYNIQYSLDIGLLEPLGLLSVIGDKNLGSKIPPPFTRQDISYLKGKSKAVVNCEMADYVSYYYRKEG